MNAIIRRKKGIAEGVHPWIFMQEVASSHSVITTIVALFDFTPTILHSLTKLSATNGKDLNFHASSSRY